MATELFTLNEASTTVSSGGTTAPAQGTAETWTVASSASFPAASSAAGTQFHVADPASTAAAAEIIAVTNVSGTTWTVTRGAESTTPVAHTAGFTVQQVITAGTLASFTQNAPWQFTPEAQGARGDGKVLGDVVTNSTTTITSASANFTSGDAGKHIMIHGANGSTSGPLLTTISSVTNSTTAVLANAAGASVSNCPAVYGTDDTAAINAAVTAAGNYATANQYFAEVRFGAKIYMLSAAPAQTGNGSTTPTFNAQIPLPFPAAAGTSQKLVISLTGAGDSGYCQYWESLVPNVAGTALVSTQTAPSTPNATFGIQSVIGGPSGSAGFTGGFANTKVVVKGLSVWCPVYTNMYACDFGFVAGMRVQQSSAHIFAPTGVNNAAVQPYLNAITVAAFTNSISSGFRTPVGGNNADSTMDDVTVEGYECAFRLADHFTAGRLAAIYSDVAVKWDASQGVAGGNQHGIFIQNMTAEAYNGGLLTAGGAAQADISWDAEGAPSAYDLNPGTDLWGDLRFGDKVDNRAPVIGARGVGNLRVVNVNLAPGHWGSPPAVPASGTAQQNTAWRDAWVSVHAGSGVTVSAITVDGTATGLTVAASSSTAVRVASGKNITLTYSGGTPTWDWWLD